MPNNDLISRADVLDLVQSYGPATYDMPYGSGDMIIRPEDVMALPAVDAVQVVRCDGCKYWTACESEENDCDIYGVCCQINRLTIYNWFCADGEAGQK